MNFRWIGPRGITAVISAVVYAFSKFDGTDVKRVHADGTLVSKELLEFGDRTEARYGKQPMGYSFKLNGHFFPRRRTGPGLTSKKELC